VSWDLGFYSPRSRQSHRLHPFPPGGVGFAAGQKILPFFFSTPSPEPESSLRLRCRIPFAPLCREGRFLATIDASLLPKVGFSPSFHLVFLVSAALPPLFFPLAGTRRNTLNLPRRGLPPFTTFCLLSPSPCPVFLSRGCPPSRIHSSSLSFELGRAVPQRRLPFRAPPPGGGSLLVASLEFPGSRLCFGIF